MTTSVFCVLFAATMLLCIAQEPVLLEDYANCTHSNQCASGCCTKRGDAENDEVLVQCIPESLQPWLPKYKCRGDAAVDDDVEEEHNDQYRFTNVQITSGPLVGTIDEELQVVAFKGVPFAAPPVGANRFRPPQPVQPWTTPRPSTNVKIICPQILYGPYTEDCLYLDVYVPLHALNIQPESNHSNPQAGANRLPVMMYIYGGSMIMGYSQQYDGSRLASSTGVIVVIPNYRVGNIGFLTLEAMRAENPDGVAGNFGMLDQRAALQWIQTNIGAFGGNPDKVTLAGQSSGAFSVCFHLVSAPSFGLYSRALMESGNCDRENRFPSYAKLQAASMRLAASVGCNLADSAALLECLRNVSLPKLVAAAYSAGPNIDGTVAGLPALPLTLIQSGQWAKVPVLIGNANADGNLFVSSFVSSASGQRINIDVPMSTLSADAVVRIVKAQSIPTLDLAQQIVNAYNQSGDISTTFATGRDFANRVVTDKDWLCATRRALVAMSTSVKTYAYMLVHSWGGSSIANHGADFQLVFNLTAMASAKPVASDYEVIKRMQYYWGHFMHFGSPNGVADANSQAQSLPANASSYLYLFWEKFNSAAENYVQLDETLVATPTPVWHNSPCAFWDTIYPQVIWP